MNSKILGFVIELLSVIMIFSSGYILFFTSYSTAFLKIMMFLIIVVVFGILAWIGLSMVEASNKMPLEQIKSEIEKEVFGGEEE